MRFCLKNIAASIACSLITIQAVLAQDLIQTDDRTDVSALTTTTVRSLNSRIDVNTHVVRARYRLAATESSSTPSTAALTYIRDHAVDFGWSADGSDLLPVETSSSAGGFHYLYRQTFEGLPVYGRYVKISVSRSNTPTMVISGYDPDIRRKQYEIDQTMTVQETAIPSIVATKQGLETSEVHSTELVWFPMSESRLVKVWKVIASTPVAPGEYELIIDAGSGAILYTFDHSFRRHGEELPTGQLRDSEQSLAVQTREETVGQSTALVDGTGLVFDPDPLSTSGSSYTPPFVDNGDADISELNAQRKTVTLLDISQSGGSYVLEGPHVAIVGGGNLNYTPPSESSADAFQYTRSETHFEAVNAYYHIDKSQRYVQSLGFDDIANSPVSINPRAFSSDNSVFSPSQNLIQFGLGGVDDAEDAGVLWHEYGHALLESSSAGLVATAEGQALHEGWSDYWAGSYLRFLVEEGTSLRTDWRAVFKWDSGDGQIWNGRTIESDGTYPEDTRCEDAGDSNGDGCNIYEDGIIWAATLMDIADELGRTVTDQLNLQSHSYLVAPVTFVDAAEALVQADIDLFGGVHTAVLISHLGNRGYINESSYGPLIVHEELPATEQLGGTRSITASVSATTAAIDSVLVWYGQGQADQRVVLTNSGGNDYSGDMLLPASPGTIVYYLEAVDESRQRATLPEGAPGDLFSFDVGPDVEAPVIEHNPIASASVVLWPPEVAAVVTDNLGISSVVVYYELHDSGGSLVEQDTFNLTGSDDAFTGAFPIAVGAVESGSMISYSIEATDASMAGNTTVSPLAGDYSFTVVNEGTLINLDFEDDAVPLMATGEWVLGAPEYGLTVAHSGSRVWATGVDAGYSGVTSRSSLDFPEFDLTTVSNAYLIFWHWYDAEYEGDVSPLGVGEGAEIWDGGNIKVSTNGGATWNVIAPVAGYTGSISNGSNPIAGEPAFGGYSFGWRREIVALPAGGPVRVRFDFGSDATNTEESEFFAGWYIDDVQLTTELPSDTDPPSVVGLPPSVASVSVNGGGAPVEMELVDDTGIHRAQLLIRSGESTVAADDVLLAMNPADANQYSGLIITTDIPVPGDRLVYDIEVEDFDGNVTRIDNGGSGFAVDYKTFLSADLLNTPVGTGLWHPNASGWIADRTGEQAERSALIANPVTLPTNSDAINVRLQHGYSVLSGAGGNVKITDDGGSTWQVLIPAGGYGGILDSEGHPMHGEPILTGTGVIEDEVFDVSAFAGEEIRIKLDLATGRILDPGESWDVRELVVEATTEDIDPEIPLELRIGANFPEPFDGTTNITYTVPESGPAKLSLYDLLGRRVRILTFSTHEPGNYTMQIDAEDLAAGMYFVVLEAAGKTDSEPITVIH